MQANTVRNETGELTCETFSRSFDVRPARRMTRVGLGQGAPRRSGWVEASPSIAPPPAQHGNDNRPFYFVSFLRKNDVFFFKQTKNSFKHRVVT